VANKFISFHYFFCKFIHILHRKLPDLQTYMFMRGNRTRESCVIGEYTLYAKSVDYVLRNLLPRVVKTKLSRLPSLRAWVGILGKPGCPVSIPYWKKLGHEGTVTCVVACHFWNKMPTKLWTIFWVTTFWYFARD
jgi:hypothetical protein